MVQNCSLKVQVEVGQRDETRGRSRYPPFGKKISKVFGDESGSLLGGFRSENSTLSGNTAGAGHRRQVRFRVTGNEGSTMIGGGRGTDGMVNKMGSEMRTKAREETTEDEGGKQQRMGQEGAREGDRR